MFKCAVFWWQMACMGFSALWFVNRLPYLLYYLCFCDETWACGCCWLCVWCVIIYLFIYLVQAWLISGQVFEICRLTLQILCVEFLLDWVEFCIKQKHMWVGQMARSHLADIPSLLLKIYLGIWRLHGWAEELVLTNLGWHTGCGTKMKVWDSMDIWASRELTVWLRLNLRIGDRVNSWGSRGSLGFASTQIYTPGKAWRLNVVQAG